MSHSEPNTLAYRHTTDSYIDVKFQGRISGIEYVSSCTSGSLLVSTLHCSPLPPLHSYCSHTQRLSRDVSVALTSLPLVGELAVCPVVTCSAPLCIPFLFPISFSPSIDRSIYFSNLLFCCALILPSFILSVACLPSSCILLSLHPSSAQFFLPPLPCHCVSSFYLPSSLSLLFAGPHTLRSPTLQYLNESYFAFLAFVLGLRPAVGPMQAGTP